MYSHQQFLRPFHLDSESRRLKIGFSVERERQRFDFKFKISTPETNGFANLVIPPTKPADLRQRCDRLWEHTCLEVFFGGPDSGAYGELNMSHSGDWNVYGFTAYRDGMRALAACRFSFEGYFETRAKRSYCSEVRSWLMMTLETR